jgi:hypothetical protein
MSSIVGTASLISSVEHLSERVLIIGLANPVRADFLGSLALVSRGSRFGVRPSLRKTSTRQKAYSYDKTQTSFPISDVS